MKPITSLKENDLLEFPGKSLGGEKPALVLYVSEDLDYSDQISALEKVINTAMFDISVHIFKEELNGLFAKKHSIKGSPTYLLFNSNAEQSRLLGKADDKDLINFLEQNLSQKEENSRG